jgi:hypothetical protein
VSDKVLLCSQALVMVGHPPVTTLEGPSAGQVVANTIYEATVTELLGMHRWRFATRALQLSRLVAEPVTEWDAAYDLPLECTIVHALEVNQEGIEFDRYGQELHCNAGADDVVVLVEGFRALEAGWPLYFESLVRLKLASIFAIAVAESEEKAGIYEGKFMRQFNQAKLLDSQGRTAAKVGVGGMARFVGGRP